MNPGRRKQNGSAQCIEILVDFFFNFTTSQYLPWEISLCVNFHHPSKNGRAMTGESGLHCKTRVCTLQ